MDGFIVLDKPTGMTSHDVVSFVRRMTGMKKVGHTGTLDPFATGVLPVALGEGTKAIPFLDESVKEYRAVMRLGTSTDTQDCTGTITRCGAWQGLTPALIEETAGLFLGIGSQVPHLGQCLPFQKQGDALACRIDGLQRGEVFAHRAEHFSAAGDLLDLVVDLLAVRRLALLTSQARRL